MESPQKPNVLVIEDDQALRAAVQDALTGEGYNVLTTSNGEEGFSAAIAQRPDVILLDILMPKMDGMILLKKLRDEGEYGKHAKVIILTNLQANDKMLSDIIETQPTYYLVKADVSLDEISAKVKEVLEN